MSMEKRSPGGAGRRQSRAGWTGSDSRDGTRAADGPESDIPATARPVVDARARTVVTPNGFLLYF